MKFLVLSAFVLGCLSAPTPDPEAKPKVPCNNTCNNRGLILGALRSGGVFHASAPATITTHHHAVASPAVTAFRSSGPVVVSGQAAGVVGHHQLVAGKAEKVGTVTTYQAGSHLKATQEALGVSQDAVKVSQDVVGNPQVAVGVGAVSYHAAAPAITAHHATVAAAPAVAVAAAPAAAVSVAASPAVATYHASAPVVTHSVAHKAVAVAPTAAVAVAAPAAVAVAAPAAVTTYQSSVPVVTHGVAQAVIPGALEKRVQYGVENRIAGVRTDIVKPKIDAPAIKAPEVFRARTEYAAPEVTVKHSEVEVHHKTAQHVPAPYDAGVVVEKTAPAHQRIDVPVPVDVPTPVHVKQPYAVPVPNHIKVKSSVKPVVNVDVHSVKTENVVTPVQYADHHHVHHHHGAALAVAPAAVSTYQAGHAAGAVGVAHGAVGVAHGAVGVAHGAVGVAHGGVGVAHHAVAPAAYHAVGPAVGVAHGAVAHGAVAHGAVAHGVVGHGAVAHGVVGHGAVAYGAHGTVGHAVGHAVVGHPVGQLTLKAGAPCKKHAGAHFHLKEYKAPSVAPEAKVDFDTK